MNRAPLFVIAHNVRSMYNIGSFFRTCDAMGVQKLYLTGHSPAPTDRFGRKEGRIAKTALGAEQSVVWEQHEDIFTLIEKLKKEGVTVVALEQDKRAIDYRAFVHADPVVIIVGNETEGIAPTVIAECDVVIEIPMRGSKESLNVSVAMGIALSHFLPPPPLSPPPVLP